MNPRKNAFANTSTGYGRKHNAGSKISGNNRFVKNENKDKKDKKDNKENKVKVDKDKTMAEKALENEKNLNSGFGDYLRSPEAVEMMKLFVFANTIMLIVTMAWPNIRDQYYWIRQWWEETFETQ